MSRPALRPTFTLPLPCGRDEAVRRLRDALECAEALRGRWRSKGRWAEIHVPAGERRIWSPHLSIRIDADGRRSRLFGRYTPDPEVWTGFMFVYFGVAFVSVLGGVFGYVQWASEQPPWGLWAPAVGAGVLAGLHGASWVGQRLGRHQMERLRGELEEVLKAAGLITAGDGEET